MDKHPVVDSTLFSNDPPGYPVSGIHSIVGQHDLHEKKRRLSAYQEVVASLMRTDPEIVFTGKSCELRRDSVEFSNVVTSHMVATSFCGHLTGVLSRLTNNAQLPSDALECDLDAKAAAA